MTGRKEFLEAILANPTDDALRLVYADFLEEQGGGDLDTATIEFIRLGCNGKNKSAKKGGPMPLKAYKWLDSNWTRLVPSIVAAHRKEAEKDSPDKKFFRERRGRIIYLGLGVTFNGRKWYTYSVSLLFWKGFILSMHAFADASRWIVSNAMQEDQPILFLGSNPFYQVATTPPEGRRPILPERVTLPFS